MPLGRRRFLLVAGAAVLARPGRAQPPAVWRGIALGAAATIVLHGTGGERLLALARAEIARLEDVFSLYRADSALSRLNRAGRLDAPPLELVDCLGLCGTIHRATEGLFDPTVQPLWQAHAEAWADGRAPSAAVLRGAMERVGWPMVEVSPARLGFARPDMALTLNGVAQGYIADRVAALLKAEGLADVLVETGEIVAAGAPPALAGWPVRVAGGPELVLADRALATSAPLGTTFDPAGRQGHILDPRTGAPCVPSIRTVSVSATSAAVADALSTGLCLAPPGDFETLAARVPGSRIEYVLPA